jgi:hypothetical protein
VDGLKMDERVRRYEAKDLSKRLKELMDLIWVEMTEGEKKEVERLKKNLVN